MAQMCCELGEPAVTPSDARLGEGLRLAIVPQTVGHRSKLWVAPSTGQMSPSIARIKSWDRSTGIRRPKTRQRAHG